MSRRYRSVGVRWRRNARRSSTASQSVRTFTKWLTFGPKNGRTFGLCTIGETAPHLGYQRGMVEITPQVIRNQSNMNSPKPRHIQGGDACRVLAGTKARWFKRMNCPRDPTGKRDISAALGHT